VNGGTEPKPDEASIKSAINGVHCAPEAQALMAATTNSN
jgi:hypothetical protein